jgi:hypothetical protein
MKIQTALAVLGLCALALAGCDRRDEKPMNTAAQQSASQTAPSAGARTTDPGAQPQRSSPANPGQGPVADSKTQQEPPAQGQADSRQAEQSQHFDNNKK